MKLQIGLHQLGRSLSLAAMVAVMGGALVACEDDWGQKDPAAGNQVYPTLKNVVKDDLNELDPELVSENVSIAEDDTLGKVLSLKNGGIFAIENALEHAENGVGVTFWAKEIPMNADSYLFAFGNTPDEIGVALTADGRLVVEGKAVTEVTVDTLMTCERWRFIAVNIKNDLLEVYSNGKSVVSVELTEDYLQKIVDMKYFYLGAGNETEYYVDALKIFRNTITVSEYTAPKIKTPGSSSGGGSSAKGPVPFYFNSFENGVGDASIVGGGKIEDSGDATRGMVFSNAVGGMRANYLLLPEDVMTRGAIKDNEAFSICVWVNRGNEAASSDYPWAPLFMGYAAAPNPENTWPMFACQYRGVLQVNGGDGHGWTDFTDPQNVSGTNILYHNDQDWLADGKWHFYTAVFRAKSAEVYYDGVLANAWNFEDDPERTAAGIWTNAESFKHICLGGNQAWNWGDPDPGFWFDNIALYDVALTVDDIPEAMKGMPDPAYKADAFYFNDFEDGFGDASVVGGGKIDDSGSETFGKIFSNAVGGMRANYLLLPEDVMTRGAIKDNEAFSICVWVNRGNETTSGDYQWSPLFMGYAAAPNPENTWPMFACQYRGVLQVNGGDGHGWTDFTDPQNVNSANILYHNDQDWLADGNWHYYTAVFRAKSAEVYFDGVLANAWNFEDDPERTAAGIWTNAESFKYICLGGNQAWNWGDPDPGFWFDDLALYDKVLTAEEVAAYMAEKKGE